MGTLHQKDPVPMGQKGRNMTLDTILEEIKKAEKIVILTHELPDGDAVGSSLATGLALEEMGKNVDIIIPEYSKSFSFLPKIDKLKNLAM